MSYTFEQALKDLNEAYSLNEMAEEKKKIENRIFFAAENIIQHLILIYGLKDTTHCLNHWIKELYAFLPNIPLCKGSNKKLSVKRIYEILNGYDDVFEKDFNSIKEAMMIKEELDSFPEIDIKACRQFINNFMYFLAQKLNSENGLHVQDIKEYLIDKI